ncbi:MAG TPA: hypothetical protein VJP77_01280, partial [Planctomycetota bacterium]|nr:hypothetical protein [Planctomycetota bacterium]
MSDPNPIARALDRAAPGCVIELAPGDYPGFGLGFNGKQGWTSSTAGGEPLRPIVIRGTLGARILPAGRSDTISVGGQVPTAHVRFEFLEIHAGERAGVMFYDLPDDRSHKGFEFVDCRIDGGWNHVAKSGSSSKWGVLGHDLEDFVFKGDSRRASVANIRHEHAFYLQSPRGDLTLEKLDASRLGRTFVQVTARERSGPPGRGLITVRDCDVSDVAIAEGDGYKGGAAFTFAGRLASCTILVEDCKYRAGFEPALRALTGPSAPYGTGALVAWGGGEAAPMNGMLILRGNDFEFAAGCGDRPVVSIGACQQVSIEDDNRFVAGAFGVALALDPLRGDGSLQDQPNG